MGSLFIFLELHYFNVVWKSCPSGPAVIFYSKFSTFKGYKQLLFEVYAANGQQMFSGLQMLIFCFCLHSQGEFSQLIFY